MIKTATKWVIFVKKGCRKMIGKSPIQDQKNLFQPLLKEFIDMNHQLVLLSEEINWKELEADFSALYSNTGLFVVAGRE
ncbi:MAG: hypothetical protein IPJ93_02105 [Bacteroidota bacterium]|nr:MAG: hypothetical protein IPJ93_02105 [Bacteroidota bacterium]